MSSLLGGKKAHAAAKQDESEAPANTSSSAAAYLTVLKDYSLLMEYKRLKVQSPTGVYVLPAADSLRRWYGVIFIRKGHYRGAIFKFVLLIPTAYPDEGPKVHFLSEVFHPLIHPDTGLLDLSLQFPVWSSNQHYIVLLLSYIKKVFYKTEYWEARPGREAMNPRAQALWSRNKEEYLQLCEKNAAKSATGEKLYACAEDPKCSIQFTKPAPAHEEAYRRIVTEGSANADGGYLEWFADGVHKLDNGLGGLPPTSSAHPALAATVAASAALLGPLSPISPQMRQQAASASSASSPASTDATATAANSSSSPIATTNEDGTVVTLEDMQQ